MTPVTSIHFISILQLLPASAISVQRYSGVSQKLTEAGKFDDTSARRFDDRSDVTFDDTSSETLGELFEKLDEKSGGVRSYGESQSRVTSYETAGWFALGKMNKLGVTRYQNNAITRRTRDDGKFFWPDSVNREGAELYSGSKDLTDDASWGWHHPDGLYATIPVGGPLIDSSLNIYLASDDAVRKFDVNGTLLWSYAPRGQLAAGPTLSDGCAPAAGPRLSATTMDDISDEEEEQLRPDWVKAFSKDFKVGDLVKVKAGMSYRADGSELYTAGDQALISGVVQDHEGKNDNVVIEWTRTGRKSTVQVDAIKNHFVRLEPKMASCTAVLICTTTNGYVFAIELATGYEVWAIMGTSQIAGVKGALASKDGVVVLATNRCTDRYCYRYRNQTNTLTPGNTVLRGLNPANGEELWNFVPEAPMWNMNPVWGQGNTFFFNDFEGTVYCLDLSTGVQVWKGPGNLGTFTEAAAVYSSSYNMVFGLGMLQYDVFAPHRAYNTNWQIGCNPYVAPGILPRCGNRGGRQGFVRAYNATSGRLRWERTTAEPPASAVAGMLNSPRLHTRLVVTLGMNCLRNSPTKILIFDLGNNGGSKAYHSMDGPTLWSSSCAGDMEGGDVRRATGGRAVCHPGSWSAPVLDRDGDMYLGNQVGVYQRWGAPTGSGAGMRDNEVLSSLVTGVAFQDQATALAEGIMAVATCTSLIVFHVASPSDKFADATWTYAPHGYSPGFNDSSASYAR